MSVLDKFLNAMKLNDDDYDDDEYLDDDVTDFEEEETQPRHRFLTPRQEDVLEEPEEEEEEEVPVKPSRVRTFSAAPAAAGQSAPLRSVPSKVSSIRSRKSKKEPGMEVCVIKPHTMEDAREITETLLANCTVVLNVEGLELEIAQRIIDFASGSCYAIDGNLQKISSYIFIITPSSVDISGDFQELLSGAFDVPFESRR